MRPRSRAPDRTSVTSVATRPLGLGVDGGGMVSVGSGSPDEDPPVDSPLYPELEGYLPAPDSPAARPTPGTAPGWVGPGPIGPGPIGPGPMGPGSVEPGSLGPGSAS